MKNNMVVIIQARMGSSRLPGKVMMDIAGYPMLWHVVNRVLRSKRTDKVMVATTTEPKDDQIEQFCVSSKVACFRGSSEDVLDRYYQAASSVGASAIVRITADCPLVDPEVIDRVVRAYEAGTFSYVSNVEPPTYPDGLDTEVFSMEALKMAWNEAALRSEREHVTPYLRKNPERFPPANIVNSKDLSGLRWTVDQQEDLELVREVYRLLGTDHFSMDAVLALFVKNPQLSGINTGIARNEGFLRSLLMDQWMERKEL